MLDTKSVIALRANQKTNRLFLLQVLLLLQLGTAILMVP
jgi:hypothetical protein